MSSKQIKTYGTNYSQEALYSVTSKGEYLCANAQLTRGGTGIPKTLNECFDRFSGVKDIAISLGFLGLSGGCGPGNCGACYVYTLWTGATAPPPGPPVFQNLDLYFNQSSPECVNVARSSDLGLQWIGCLWGVPEAPYSCSCPDIGPLFHAYAKLRLNVATFWNTPKNTPVKRAEFLDAIKYGKKANITVAGDFKLKIGQVVQLNANAVSGFPYSSTNSILNGLYYIIGVKHVVTNSGGHETALALTQIPPLTPAGLSAGSPGATFATDYQ